MLLNIANLREDHISINNTAMGILLFNYTKVSGEKF